MLGRRHSVLLACALFALPTLSALARETALHRAALASDKAALAEALRREPHSVNATMEALCGPSNYHGGSGTRDCQRGVTPLMLAAIGGDEALIRLLLDAGASARAVSSRGWTAADFALEFKRPRDLRALALLVERGDPAKRLEFAARHLQGVQPLVCGQARTPEVLELFVFLVRLDPAGFTRPSTMSDECYRIASDALAGRPIKPLPHRLLLAAEAGQLQALERELALGADPDSRDSSGRSALYLAAARGRGDVIARLLAAGADPNIRNESPAAAGRPEAAAGATPLMALTRAHGCEDISSNGPYPLHCMQRLENVARLIGAGARADLRDAAGRTAEMLLPAPETFGGRRYQEQFRWVLGGAPYSVPPPQVASPPQDQPTPVPLTPEQRRRDPASAAVIVAPSAASARPTRGASEDGGSVYGSGRLPAR